MEEFLLIIYRNLDNLATKLTKTWLKKCQVLGLVFKYMNKGYKHKKGKKESIPILFFKKNIIWFLISCATTTPPPPRFFQFSKYNNVFIKKVLIEYIHGLVDT